MKTYCIRHKKESIDIDANWNKPFWRTVESIGINHAHAKSSEFRPQTQVKMAYDESSIYLIFRVQDQYIRAITTQTHGPVNKDSCVEFFFAPNLERPHSYFNLETNCCGVLLMQHYTGPREKSRYLDIQDCKKLQIASSASGPIRHEITKPLTWTLEYALPVEILDKYANFQKPAPGIIWYGNFYKCADNSSHPHWISWSPVLSETPDFHRPDAFGNLEFE